MTLGALGVLLQAMLSVSKNIIRIFILNSYPSQNTANPDSTVYLFDKVPFKRLVLMFQNILIWEKNMRLKIIYLH